MTKQWDKYREIIIAEYKDHNKPLHEVQRFMAQKYGFRASTRAYRSRFDRWGIHKYSRRRRLRSTSLDRRESMSDGEGQHSPRDSPDIEDGCSQAATPLVETPHDLFGPGVCLPTPGTSFRSSLCLAKTDFPYTPITPSPSPAIAHSPAYQLGQFGSGYAAFGTQNIGCYSSNSMPMYRQDIRGVMIADPNASGSSQIASPWSVSQPGTGIQWDMARAGNGICTRAIS